MKKFLKFAILLLFIPAFVLTSCKDDTDDPAPERTTDVEFQTLKDHLVASNLDLTNIIADGWITTATNVNDNLSTYYVIDIRSAEQYNAGHIDGAVNSSLSNLLTEAANAGDKKIVVVCVTGQTAGHAVCALRLSGYADAQVLKWGMCGWTSNVTTWGDNVDDIAGASPSWVTTDILDQTTEFDDPDITEQGDGATILTARVSALLTVGFQAVDASTVLGTPGNYYINNFWDAADVTKYGHISGAYRIKPLTLENGEYMHLDPSKDIVTYCWTGQTSSMVTAYLYVLGYDALSLKFGANKMIHTTLEGHKWSSTQCANLAIVTN